MTNVLLNFSCAIIWLFSTLMQFALGHSVVGLLNLSLVLFYLFITWVILLGLKGRYVWK